MDASPGVRRAATLVDQPAIMRRIITGARGVLAAVARMPTAIRGWLRERRSRRRRIRELEYIVG